MSKERLEEIKKNIKMHMEWAKGTHYAEITEEELKDYEWLIQQAERVQELEKENKRLEDFIETIQNVHFVELQREKAENRRYREALEFYAERDNYQWEVSYRPQQEIDCMVIDDSGHTARKALEGEE